MDSWTMRGTHNGEAWCEHVGPVRALAWLANRIEDNTKPPLDPRYIEAFKLVCANWSKK